MTKASLVDEIDSLLPHWFIERVAPHWFPPYIHVLRANPSTVHKVKLDPAWPVVDVTDYDGSTGSGDVGDQSTGAQMGGLRMVGRPPITGRRGPQRGTLKGPEAGRGGQRLPLVAVDGGMGAASSLRVQSSANTQPEAGTISLRRILEGAPDTEIGGLGGGMGEATSGIAHDELIQLLLQVGWQPILKFECRIVCHSYFNRLLLLQPLFQAVGSLQATVEEQGNRIAALTDSLNNTIIAGRDGS